MAITDHIHLNSTVSDQAVILRCAHLCSICSGPFLNMLSIYILSCSTVEAEHALMTSCIWWCLDLYYIIILVFLKALLLIYYTEEYMCICIIAGHTCTLVQQIIYQAKKTKYMFVLPSQMGGSDTFPSLCVCKLNICGFLDCWSDKSSNVTISFVKLWWPFLMID